MFLSRPGPSSNVGKRQVVASFNKSQTYLIHDLPTENTN